MQREWVHVRPILETCKAMIDKPVRALVAPDGVYDIKHLRVSTKSPVVLGDTGSRQVRPTGKGGYMTKAVQGRHVHNTNHSGILPASISCMHRVLAGSVGNSRWTQCGRHYSLCDDSFLFEMANEPMTCLRREQIAQDWNAGSASPEEHRLGCQVAHRMHYRRCLARLESSHGTGWTGS